MITDITIVHNDPKFNLSKLNFPYPVCVKTFDVGTKQEKRKGWELKTEWGAKADPFIICYDKDRVIKCFYTEADHNVYKSLIEFLNGQLNENSSCRSSK